MLNSGTAPRLFWATVIVVAAIGYVQHNVRAWRGGQDDFRQFYVAAQITSGQRPGPLYFPFRQLLLLLPITALLVQMFERPVSAGFVACVAAATFVLARPGIRHPDLHLLTLGLLAIWMVSGWALQPGADVTLPRFWEKGRDSHTCAQVFAQHARQATSRDETGIAREIRTGRWAI